jgi:hypothetical protein
MRWEEELLVSTARSTSWPAIPDLRARVLARIEPPTRPIAHRRVARSRLVRAVAMVAVALLVVLLSVPRVRTVVAEFFGLVEGYRIEFVATPAATATSGSATATTVASTQDIGRRTTLEDATQRVGFEPALPVGQITPEVYVLSTGGSSPVTLAVVLRFPDFDLWESRAFSRYFLMKGAPEGTVIATASVRGHPAYWVGGVPRVVRFVDAAGVEVPGSARTVTRNALMWNGERTLYRIETDLPLNDALRIAASLP